MRETHPPRPVRPGPVPRPLQQGQGASTTRKRLEEAERELEEAYLLRPRDPKVLNLLGLVYFKQEKFEKAEEVYRKLVAESPEAHTLYYNLGLIYFKLNRLEEAESAFLKALELATDNPKINFYLGSIYERLQRFQDAIYQYRQAGANIMVRRVEDKIAAAARGSGLAPPATAAPAPQGRHGRVPEDQPPGSSAANRSTILPKHARSGPRTDGYPFAGQRPCAPSARSCWPRAPPAAIMTGHRPLPPQTEAPADSTLPPHGATASRRSSRSRSRTDRPAGTPSRLPRRATEVFRFLENNLMEIDFSGKVFIKQGTIYSYSGNLTFWVKDKRPGGAPALVIITGTGKVILTDKDREITFMQVAGRDDLRRARPPAGLRGDADAALRAAWASSLGGSRSWPSRAAGMVALSVASKPLTLSRDAGPAGLGARRLGHHLERRRHAPPRGRPPDLRGDAPAGRRPAGPLVRLEGSGRVLVEQTSP